ncbi:Methanol-cobalamin methyltransferase B subunit [Anaerohalosphaera lusitana]|uniref:Methanol-cobalamin methyltransferase B subunit n=1 Tax=Anaerohalosphaera lusitana TaxID=1936003 RepID=A0A1U9NGY2_9BACT|nr:methyltransferase MtaB domain-containing protein [Anaerohalosphaera lusitana]AQT67192.1 Methanol-cobalamin methyltransferase B subunit [Anaerohalosphaera lusitana]
MSAKIKITHTDNFIYGTAPNPVTCGHDLSIGTGTVIPEINFTLPGMEVTADNMPAVLAEYAEIIDNVLKRAVHLNVPQLLVEFETLPEMTTNPEWGLKITRLLADKIAECHKTHGIALALRLTINDIREFSRPPILRSGKYLQAMDTFLAGAAEAGADMIAIESTGGKEVNDNALISCDLPAVVFALGILGARDMDFLWNRIVTSCSQNNIIPSGDSACGFANTAMVLAEQKMIPRIFAALVRVISVPRSLVAVTAGAVGPTKDCAYEGPFIKAITGVPISMEGRSAACAHLSTIGNIAQAVCDCWSNESVQNVQLLSAKAPTVSMEQLAYDCRLLTTAARSSHEDARRMRDWLTESDASLDPQAYVLRPDVVIEISKAIAAQPTPYLRTRAAASATLEILRTAHTAGKLHLRDNEIPWLDMLQTQVDSLPEDENELIEQMLNRPDIKNSFHPEEYDL